jgi:hypothetical protein
VAAIARGIFGPNRIFLSIAVHIMNKKLLLLAGAFGALFGSKALTQTKPLQIEQPAATKVEQGPQYTPRTFATRKPAPAKPTSQQAPQRKAVAQIPPMFPSMARFIERPGPRKVKYGKHHWLLI